MHAHASTSLFALYRLQYDVAAAKKQYRTCCNLEGKMPHAPATTTFLHPTKSTLWYPPYMQLGPVYCIQIGCGQVVQLEDAPCML